MNILHLKKLLLIFSFGYILSGTLPAMQGTTNNRPVVHEAAEAIETCPICYDDIIDNHLILVCGHQLHQSCFNELQRNRFNSCPMCRMPLIARPTGPIRTIFDAIKAYNKLALQRLLLADHNQNVRNIYGETPLFEAVRECFPEAVAILIRYGAHINARNHNQETPLHMIMRMNFPRGNQRLAIFHLLIEANGDINARNLQGETLLHYAVKERNIEICRLCLAHGANPNIENNCGETAIDVATDSNIISLLRKHTSTTHVLAHGYRSMIRDIADFFTF